MDEYVNPSLRRSCSGRRTYPDLRGFLALDMGGEDLYIDTKDVPKLLIVGDSAIRLLITLRARSIW